MSYKQRSPISQAEGGTGSTLGPVIFTTRAAGTSGGGR